MPGGVSRESRRPVYIERAVGSREWDVDGNEYVDYSMGSAALLLGHAHPDVTKEISETAPKGTYYANGHPLYDPMEITGLLASQLIVEEIGFIFTP